MDRAELEGLDREALVARAQASGIRRARILTRPELIDELLRSDPSADPTKLSKSRGFFGRARDLVARVVERGLHLPDAAERIREIGALTYSVPRPEPQALPTVTLAEIYAAQGHHAKAVTTVRLVLTREPDHAAARALLARLEDAGYVAPAPALPPEPEDDAAAARESDVEESPPESEGALTMSHPPASASPESEGVVTASHPASAPLESEGAVTASHPASTPPASTPPESEAAVTASHPAPSEAFAQEADEGPISASPRAASVAPPAIGSPSACVAVPTGSGRLSVFWRLDGSPRSGRFVVRVCVVLPSWDGPRVETRDVDAPVREGELELEGLPERAVVRVAIGWIEGGVFAPEAHSPAIERAGAGLVLWSTSGAVPLRADDDALTLTPASRAASRAALGG